MSPKKACKWMGGGGGRLTVEFGPLYQAVGGMGNNRKARLINTKHLFYPREKKGVYNDAGPRGDDKRGARRYFAVQRSASHRISHIFSWGLSPVWATVYKLIYYAPPPSSPEALLAGTMPQMWTPQKLRSTISRPPLAFLPLLDVMSSRMMNLAGFPTVRFDAAC